MLGIDFYGNKMMFEHISVVQMIPGQLTIVPSYLIMKHLDWLNTYASLIVPGVVECNVHLYDEAVLRQLSKGAGGGVADGWLEPFRNVLSHRLKLVCLSSRSSDNFCVLGAWNDF